MKDHYVGVSLALLLVLTIVVTQSSLSAKGNGYIPTPANRIEIFEPRNETYTNGTVVLNFNVSEAYRSSDFKYTRYDFNYSIDNQEMQVVENLNITREYDLNPYKNPYMPVADLVGNVILGNLSDGWHNVTVYEIGEHFYKNEWHAQVVNSETVSFKIDTTSPIEVQEPFPIAPVAVASGAALAAVGIGLLVYFKKRKHVDAKQVK